MIGSSGAIISNEIPFEWENTNGKKRASRWGTIGKILRVDDTGSVVKRYSVEGVNCLQPAKVKVATWRVDKRTNEREKEGTV